MTDHERAMTPRPESSSGQAEQPAETVPDRWMLHDMEFATVVTAQKPGRFIAACDGRSFTPDENLAHAEFIAAAPETAAERDRLVVENKRLVEELTQLSNEVGCWREEELAEIGGWTNARCLLEKVSNARALLDEARKS